MCLHCCNEMKNSCGKQICSHPCTWLHSHNKATLTSLDVIPSKLFTFKNIEIGNGFSMCIDVRQHKQPFSFIWNDGMHQFGSNLGEHKHATITNSLCIKFITIRYHVCIIVVQIIGILQVVIERHVTLFLGTILLHTQLQGLELRAMKGLGCVP